ncbi:MAG: hypothetical protein ACO3PX_15705, partial [bacterium]
KGSCDNSKRHRQSTTYTYAQIRREVNEGVHTILNNAQVGEAYHNQLYHQPSLAELVQRHRQRQQLNDQHEGDQILEDAVEFHPDNGQDPFSDDDVDNNNDDENSSLDDNVQPDDASSSSNNTSMTDEHPNLPKKYTDTAKRYDTMKNKMPTTPAPDRFHYKNNMSARATAYAELLMICQKHGGNKALYDDIAHWAQSWESRYPNCFAVKNRIHKWNRKRILKHIKAVFKFNSLEPVIHTVELHDGRKVSVPEVDFAESMRSILNDRSVMAHIMKGLDPQTWRPLFDEVTHESDPNAVIHDKDTGWMYWQGIKLHCPDAPEVDPRKVRPFPVLIHIDQSHTNVFGHLKVAPVQMMPAMIDVDGQQEISSWRQTATIPNLSVGLGKDKKRGYTALNKLRDYHKVLEAALSSFKQCYEDGGFLWVDDQGNDIVLKPYVLFFIGDIAGVNEMVGHYNNCNANCLAKDCHCTQDDLLQFPPKCKPMRWLDLQQCETVEEVFDLYESHNLISERDMDAVLHDELFARSISKHPIKNAFDGLPLADPYQGIIGMTPQEFLHMMGGGIYKYIIMGIKDIVGENTSNQADKASINEVFPDIKEYLSRNAEKDINRMSNRNGFFDLTSLTSQEVRGNFFGLVIFMHTTYGREILQPLFEEKNIDYDDMLETCLLVLSWERFYLDSQKRMYVEDAEAVTWDLQQRIMKHIPRQAKDRVGHNPGSKGWRIVKFKAMSFMTALNLKFGCAKCYDTGPNENNHKRFVKGNAKLTQRIASKFSTQLARNDFDRVVIGMVYDAISQYCSKDHKSYESGVVSGVHRQYYDDSDEDDHSDESDDDDEDRHNNDHSLIRRINRGIEGLTGMYNLCIDIDARMRITVSHKWKERGQTLLGIEPNTFLPKAIAELSCKYRSHHNMGTATRLKLECYTRAVINGNSYRCSPYWKGSSWYDWATVTFPNSQANDNEQNQKCTCACRILGFFRYLSPGALTYGQMELQGHHPDDVEQSLDDTLYVLLHCQTTYFSFHQLQSRYIRKIEMTDTNQMYIVPASWLRNPLLVVPDIIDLGHVSEERFMVICPWHKSGSIFLHYVNLYMEQHGHPDDDEFDMTEVGGDIEGDSDSDYEDNW